MSNESNTAAIIPNHRKALAIAISTAVAGTGTALAAETILEEVIVTATKREEIGRASCRERV